MSQPIRLALIGLGKIAHDQHLPAIANDPAFELVATVSRHGEAIGSLPFFATIDALAESGIAVDAVALCTPPQVRRALAATAIDRGWHVFLEKPPAASLVEASALRALAAAKGVSLFASWHSRHAAGVEPARAWLAERMLRDATITWAEDVRHWHPGQDWIFEPGGFGVFDPAINALSIATRIFPRALFVETAEIEIPANRAAAIAATVRFRDEAGSAIDARFDFLKQGTQSWDIVAHTDGGTLTLSEGGTALAIDGDAKASGADELASEYPALYRRFAELVRAGESEVDLSPLQLVADIHLKARIRIVDPFAW
ncbi:Gfo/Idh/MocA family oxidoreductase [Sphingomonas sp. ST-64]|uniref:Gfo/Idh/MocA family oxidoreductase n=1 Tax=Sphingomonas plantiphila TaxID=3163295 RepID=A0ABW8YS45_9SPHN